MGWHLVWVPRELWDDFTNETHAAGHSRRQAMVEAVRRQVDTLWSARTRLKDPTETIEVTPAQVKAAQLLVDLDDARGDRPSDAVRRIANAHEG